MDYRVHSTIIASLRWHATKAEAIAAFVTRWNSYPQLRFFCISLTVDD